MYPLLIYFDDSWSSIYLESCITWCNTSNNLSGYITFDRSNSRNFKQQWRLLEACVWELSRRFQDVSDRAFIIERHGIGKYWQHMVFKQHAEINWLPFNLSLPPPLNVIFNFQGYETFWSLSSFAKFSLVNNAICFRT